MKLAKPHLDIGLFTGTIREQRAFWSDTIGLRLDHKLEMAPGWMQNRFDAHGSVIKVNHRRTGMRKRPPSGFTTLTIARGPATEDWAGPHPGGDRVELVAPGTRGITGIGVTVSTPRPDRLLDFYASALEFKDAGDGRLLCGDSVLTVVEGPGGTDVDDFSSPGFRYLTVQVFDADREMDAIVRRGGRIARDVVNFAGIARYGFVADPDGNWIEISARTSLTGVAVS